MLLQTVCMLLGFLFNIPLAESPTFASSPNRIEAQDLHRLPFVTFLRPYFALHSSFLWLPGAPTSDWLPWCGRPCSQNCPQCASTLSVLLHLCCLGWSWCFTLAPMCFYTDCTSPFVLSPLVLVLHTGPRKGNCISPFVCLITALCILLSFLWLLWDEGFLVFPIPPSVTALGQFSFRQVSPLGSPFVSLLVAALRRRNSYVFHVSNDIIRCPLWPQCY